MDESQNVILRFAAKQVGGGSLSDSERRVLRGLVASTANLVDPIHVYCRVRNHREWGTVVLPNQMVEGEVRGGIRFERAHYVCTSCGNDSHVELEPCGLVLEE
jgi:hypothetical protein